MISSHAKNVCRLYELASMLLCVTYLDAAVYNDAIAELGEFWSEEPERSLALAIVAFWRANAESAARAEAEKSRALTET